MVRNSLDPDPEQDPEQDPDLDFWLDPDSMNIDPKHWIWIRIRIRTGSGSWQFGTIRIQSKGSDPSGSVSAGATISLEFNSNL